MFWLLSDDYGWQRNKKQNIRIIFPKKRNTILIKLAIEKKTCARGLRSILEDVMLNIMYELPDKKEHDDKEIKNKI